MELRKVTTIETMVRLTSVPSFNLQKSSAGNYFLQLREKQFEVCQVDYKLSEERKDQFRLTRYVRDYPSDWPTKYLTKDKTAVFKSLNEDNYIDVVLNGKWDPETYHQKPANRPLKMDFYQQTSGGRTYLGILMSSGAFHLYKRNGREWNSCCDIGSTHVKQIDNGREVRSYTAFQEVLGQAEILSFDWLEENNSQPEHVRILWLTRNGSLFIGELNSITNGLKIAKMSHKLEDACQISVIPNVNGSHLLLSISKSGNVSLFEITGHSTEKNSLLSKLTDLWTDSDDISVSFVDYKVHGQGLRIFLVKGAYLIVFELNRTHDVKETIIERLPGPFVTGLQLIDETQFIITLPNQKVLHGTLIKSKISLAEMKNDFNPNYSCSGIVCAKNKAIWMLSFTASKSFDYRQLKCPSKMILCSFSQMSPIQFAIDDPERKISNHFEYFEIIRLQKIPISFEYKKVQELISNEVKNGDLEKIVYLLKIQVFLLQSSMNGEKAKAPEGKRKDQFLRDVVLMIQFHDSLKKLLKINTQLTDRQISSIGNLRSFVSTQLQAKEQFDQSVLLQWLKEDFKFTMDKCKQLARQATADKCALCDQEVVLGNLNCIQMHKFNRCCYTNLQVPLMTIPNCRICGMQSLDSNAIEEILDVKISQKVCAICDVEIE